MGVCSVARYSAHSARRRLEDCGPGVGSSSGHVREMGPRGSVETFDGAEVGVGIRARVPADGAEQLVSVGGGGGGGSRGSGGGAGGGGGGGTNDGSGCETGGE